MALYDWNKNGKKDFGDDYIEYNIYKDVMGKNDEEDRRSYTPGSSDPSNFLVGVIGLAGAIFGIWLIFEMFGLTINEFTVWLIFPLFPVFFIITVFFVFYITMK